MSNATGVRGEGRPKLFPSGVKPSAGLQDRVAKILRSRSIDRFAVELGTSAALLAKIEGGMCCKPGAAERVEALLDARDAKGGV